MTRFDYIQSKIKTTEEAIKLVELWKLKNNKVVFTNGCFDILHKGHVTYLSKTANLGHKLIVGINSDFSVKQQGKGEDRPLNTEDARQLIIASLGFVDCVVMFNEQTPLNLIKELLPDILVKGADYDPNEKDPTSKKYIVGSDEVIKNGGMVHVVDLEEGYSTTNLVQKIKKQ
jgi:rfaE bifunctional protein nucleotidyltransferase chain/domain